MNRVRIDVFDECKRNEMCFVSSDMAVYAHYIYCDCAFVVNGRKSPV